MDILGWGGACHYSADPMNLLTKEVEPRGLTSRIFAVKQRVTNSFNLSFKRNVCEARHVLLDSFASGGRVGPARSLLSRVGGGGPGVCLNSEPGLTARNWAAN